MSKETLVSFIVMLLETASTVLLGVFVFLTWGTVVTTPVLLLLVAYLLTSTALTVRVMFSGKGKKEDSNE